MLLFESLMIKTVGIVQNGLALHLDANNTGSYPGTGTAWTDLSGNSNNFTLTNGPTFNSANGGSIAFDGTNDYATRSNVFMLGGKNKRLTVELAFYLPTGGGGYLITNERETNDTGHGWYYCSNSELYFEQHSTNFPPYVYYCKASSTGFSKININGWNIVSWGVSIDVNSMFVNYLINGYTETITNNSLTWMNDLTTEDNIFICRHKNHVYSDSYLNCRIASVRIYNRLLTKEEQFQNFNATRGRFNI